MNEMRFEWNEAKSQQNRKKHKVSFEEAQTVFLDENALRFFDPDHSADEDRFLMLGISCRLRVVIVCTATAPLIASFASFRREERISVKKLATGEEGDSHERAL